MSVKEPSVQGKNPAKTNALDAESAVVDAVTTADVSLAMKPPAEATDFDAEAYAREVARIRALRQPFGALQRKLALPERRGYKRHWFNDEPGRVDQKLAEGWAHIADKEGKPVKRVVGSGRNNSILVAYAMEIPSVIFQEWADAQDQVARDKIDDIRKHPVRSPKGLAQPSDSGKFYSPKDEMVRVVEDKVPLSRI